MKYLAFILQKLYQGLFEFLLNRTELELFFIGLFLGSMLVIPLLKLLQAA